MPSSKGGKEGKYEYQVVRLSEANFEVRKFLVGYTTAQPLAIYNVVFDSLGRIPPKCSCPASTFRGTGERDKHVKLVGLWVRNGDRWLPLGQKEQGAEEMK